MLSRKAFWLSSTRGGGEQTLGLGRQNVGGVGVLGEGRGGDQPGTHLAAPVGEEAGGVRSNEKACCRLHANRLEVLVGRAGFEPATNRLKVYCSTD